MIPGGKDMSKGGRYLNNPQKTVKEHYFTFANSRAGWDILVHQVIFDKDGKLLSAFPPMSDALVLKEKHVDIADDLPF